MLLRMTHESVAKLAQLVRSYAALVAALAALVTSIRACNKPTDTRPAQATFDTVSPEIERLAATQAKLYDDLVALQTYIIRTHEEPVAPAVVAHSVGSTSARSMSVAPFRRAPLAPPKLSAKPSPWRAPPFTQVLAMYEAAPASVPELQPTPAVAAVATADVPPVAAASAPADAPLVSVPEPEVSATSAEATETR